MCNILAYIHTCISRLKLVAARDGLLPTFLSGIHNDFCTPLPAILVQVCTLICSISTYTCTYLLDTAECFANIFLTFLLATVLKLEPLYQFIAM